MSDWEKFVVPDWVVKDYNSRVPKEDKLPLYDGTDDYFENVGDSKETYWDIEMRKALFRNDHAAYRKAMIERRVEVWGAKGFSREEVMKMFKHNKEECLRSRDHKFDLFMFGLIFIAFCFLACFWRVFGVQGENNHGFAIVSEIYIPDN